jgi:uncharacterized protein (TIGR00255 family)
LKKETMIKSMTGYGKAVAELQGQRITVEVKSLNSKQLDLNLRMPGSFRPKEHEVRSLIAEKAERGKVDLILSIENTGEALNYSINRPLARKYYEELRSLVTELGERPDNLLPVIVKMPDVLQTSHEEINETEWSQLKAGIVRALEQFDAFRRQEGQVLEKDMIQRVKNILEYLTAVGPLEVQRISEIRDGLRAELTKLRESLQGKNGIDENRFEQELIYYLERMDFTEEKVRLMKHCEYFLETLNDTQAPGKKLGFIVQEMGREINTLGSKAYDAAIQKLVVQMKDELEKIKEQVLNIL